MPGTKRVQSMKSSDMRYSRRVWPFRLGRQMLQLVEVVLAPLRPRPLRRATPRLTTSLARRPREQGRCLVWYCARPSCGVKSQCQQLRLRGEAVAMLHGGPAWQLLTGSWWQRAPLSAGGLGGGGGGGCMGVKGAPW